MNIITRRHNQSFHIGPDVVVTVVGFHGRTVKLGFIATASYQIYRQELYREILQEINRGDIPLQRPSQGGMLVLTRKCDQNIVIAKEGIWVPPFASIFVDMIKPDGSVMLGITTDEDMWLAERPLVMRKVH